MNAHTTIIEELPDDPALRDSYSPSPTEPAARSAKSTSSLRPSSSLSTTTATLLPTPEKAPAAQHTGPHPPDANPFDTDLEAVVPTDSCRRARRCEENAVWPGKEHWKRKAKEAKRGRRMCTCMASLSRRTRIAVKIGIGLLIVGVAVGVGFGVSKPLGAPIWGDNANDR